MIKNLLSIAAMTFFALGASAETVDLWSGKTVFEGWSQNITISAGDLTALSTGDKITATLEDCGTVLDKDYSTIVLKTNVENWPELDGFTYENPPKGATEWSWVLSEAAVKTAKATGIIIQGENFTVTKVTLTTAADIDHSILWEGSAALTGWASGGDVTSSKVKAGDVITYTFTGSADEGGQALVKNASWKDVMGTAKINAADMNTGKVVVGVTTAMEEMISSKFFLQGDKGATLVKVSLTEENGFDVARTLSYGERALPSEQFFTIPENAVSLAVVLDKKPDWIQLCNGSWTNLIDNNSPDVTFTTNADNTVTMTALIDSDFITAINGSSKMVLNGGGASVLSVAYNIAGSTAITDIEAADENAPVEYYNLQGVRVENPSNGLYIRRQGNKVTKVII